MPALSSCLPTEVLIDSGTSKHLVCKKSLGTEQLRQAYPSSCKFATAADEIQSCQAVDWYPEGFATACEDIKTPMQVLPHCPDALSPGILSEQYDIGFWWPPGSWKQPPQLLHGVSRGPELTQDGIAFDCQVKDNVSVMSIPPPVGEVATWPADSSHPLAANEYPEALACSANKIPEEEAITIFPGFKFDIRNLRYLTKRHYTKQPQKHVLFL